MLLLAITAGLSLALLDRLSKAVVSVQLALGTERRIVPGVRLRYVRHRLNPAVVDEQRRRLLALLLAACFVLIWSGSQTPLWQTPLATIGLGMAVAGAGSNLWDRLQRYTFVDFICIGRWPAFNLADAGVCIGAVLALVRLF